MDFRIGERWQHVDPISETAGAILSIATFSTAVASLS
jgi:hypothetical protein